MSTTDSGATSSEGTPGTTPEGDGDTDAPVFQVYTDASVRPELEAVGVGWVVCRDDRVLCRGRRSRLAGYTTQEAEAFAVKCAVEQLQAMDWFDSDVTIHTDNEGVAIAFERETRLHRSDVFCELLDHLSENEVKQIKRGDNSLAHDLSQEAREQLEIEEGLEEREEICPRCGNPDPNAIECKCSSRNWFKCKSCGRSFFDRD